MSERFDAAATTHRTEGRDSIHWPAWGAWTRLLAWLIVTGLLAGCSEQATTLSPSPVSNPRGAPAPQSDPALTGIVFETTEQGRRPVSSARVVVVDLLDGPYGDYGWSEVSSDASGRFSIASLPRGRPVKVTAYVGPNGGLWNQSSLFQVCAVHPTIDGDTTADVELVQAGIRPTTYGSPTLSGVVFETSKGRRPVAGAPVLYSSNNHDGADVYARTDHAGRYSFCRLPLGTGYVLVGCAGAVTPFPGFRYTKTHVEVQGDTVLDIDVTESISSCP
jgi:hypothetical protein